MHEATRMLREEHEVILRVSDVTEVMANAIESGAEPPAQFLRDLVEFCAGMRTVSITEKKKICYFSELEKKGMPRNGGPRSA